MASTFGLERTVGHPDTIGAYRVIGVLGVGGMGVVYEAEQLAPIQRRVAIKVIRAGYGARDITRRFETERQSLAVMEHPSIARVYDAGATPEGMPYVVMECVEGVPFGEYCDAHRLSTRERLELFLPVCHAVQHAHHKGVIHRDLKPSNVLVSEQAGVPIPKVIDFGIAKAVNRRLTSDTLVTEIGLVVGTPAYMSPEQAQGTGVDVDTRSDVHALGVMLYEVLTGTLPADPSKIGLVLFIARLSSGFAVSQPPSSRVTERETREKIAELRRSTPAAVARELRGDLDAIVLKAIAPERERRYQTAQELANDIERHIKHEPIAARAPSFWYRTGKFARRHPTATTLAAAIALFLVGLTMIMAIQSRRIARARTLADQRRAQAEDLINYMVGDLRGKLEPIGRLKILDDIGTRALAYFAAVPASELTNDELLRRSQALGQLGQVRMSQGDLDAAMPAFREALVLARDLTARNPANTQWQVARGAGHFWVGYTHFLRGDLDSALAEFEAYLAVSRWLVQQDSTRADWQMEMGYAFSNIGSVREARGDLLGALSAFRFTLGVKQRLVELDTANMDWLLDLAHTENTVGRAQERLGELDSAETHYRTELRIVERLAARDTSNMTWRQALVPALTYAGGVEELRGRPARALAGYDSAFRVTRELHARDSTNTLWTRDLGVTSYLAGRNAVVLGREADGIERLTSARRVLRHLVTRDTTNADFRLQLAIAESELARALAARGDAEGAGAGVGAAEALLMPLVARPNAERRLGLELARVRLVGAELYRQRGATAQAWEKYRAALDALGPDAATDELRALHVRARALVGLGRANEAVPLVERLKQAGYREVAFTRFAARLASIQRH